MVDLHVPPALGGALRAMLREADPGGYEQTTTGDGLVFRLVLAAEKVEPFLDALDPHLQGTEGVRVVVLPVAVLAPRPPEAEADAPSAPDEDADETRPADRISRDELHGVLQDGARIGPTFLSMTVLAAIVAAIGLARDNPAVVIGAMVIAPLLGPNMALALATTLADGALGLRALRANAAGVLVASAVACLAGTIWSLDPHLGEILGRTSVSAGEIVLALASGAAGAIAVTSGAASSLVGVMVAVALMPPLVTACMLFVQGHGVLAWRAVLLLTVNIVSVNLAAVTVFRLRGIRPSTWWDDARAARATRWALAFWILLLAAVVALVLVADGATVAATTP
jgi:uncharacterized hydrophobic protein (TIGR00341 family)